MSKTIFVSSATGRLLSFLMKTNDTIKILKSYIYEKEGIPAD